MARDPLDHGVGVRPRSRIVGDLRLPKPAPAAPSEPGFAPDGPAAPPSPPPPPLEAVEVLLELNDRYPGPPGAAALALRDLWQRFLESHHQPGTSYGTVSFRIARVTDRLYQAVLTRAGLAALLDFDGPGPAGARVIFRAWPDYPMEKQIDRSAPTIKATAARRTFAADGAGIVWAVVDTGIDAAHPHFSALELARCAGAQAGADCPLTAGLHQDFSRFVRPSEETTEVPTGPLVDEDGHGTHVAGIIAGACPPDVRPHIACSDEATDGGFVPRTHNGELAGMAPACELVSLKVFRRINGVAVTSSAAVIAALDSVLASCNGDRSRPRIHGVNLSLGCAWDASHYAAGQSPLCQLIDQLVDAGVVVVVSAGNNGSADAVNSANQSIGVLASITEPAHAERCITVGSTHRDAPMVFGVTWTSSKGPTLDGRMKPDVVAPGEWICSAATGTIRARARLANLTDTDPLATYAEQSGTSMAAPHVSGVIAAFLSAQRQYIGKPDLVKQRLIASAHDLSRDRYAQGAGLVDAHRMLDEA